MADKEEKMMVDGDDDDEYEEYDEYSDEEALAAAEAADAGEDGEDGDEAAAAAGLFTPNLSLSLLSKKTTTLVHTPPPQPIQDPRKHTFPARRWRRTKSWCATRRRTWCRLSSQWTGPA